MMNPDDQPARASAQADRRRERLLADYYQCLLRELAAGFAHELNQPLAAIAAYAEGAAALMQRDPEQQAQALRIIQEISRQALRAGDTVQRVRNAVRTGGPERRRLDLNELVGEVLPLLDPLAGESGVHVATSLCPEAVLVTGDPARLQTLVMVLFQNAVDAVAGLPAGERQVTISVTTDQQWVELAVSDLGAGVAPDAARELFRPFFSTKPEGAGLGLAVCRSIAREHHGELRFENLPGGGARFAARLPRADANR
jgi:C4-dicarboxylate-specific signal transduction histidine kinase